MITSDFHQYIQTQLYNTSRGSLPCLICQQLQQEAHHIVHYPHYLCPHRSQQLQPLDDLLQHHHRGLSHRLYHHQLLMICHSGQHIICHPDPNTHIIPHHQQLTNIYMHIVLTNPQCYRQGCVNICTYSGSLYVCNKLSLVPNV